MKKAAFLDRDGVLIRSDLREGKPIAVQDIERLEILPGVEAACRALRDAGYLLVIVTNQPDVGRGLVAQSVVEDMNRSIAASLGITSVHVCFHDGRTPCQCRKPEPGMLMDAAQEFGIDLGRSVMVGDRSSDIEAGIRAGCRTVFIEWGQSEVPRQAAHHTAPSLYAALGWILAG
jgi:D-glycero-D-manno-heptose 1,7-bisphosphate phosphatase